jgi:hypothetical protein
MGAAIGGNHWPDKMYHANELNADIDNFVNSLFSSE